MLKIENEFEEIPQSVGVRQGDNMAPVLFLFLMAVFAETLELEWKKLDIPTKNVQIKKITAYEILQCLYVNDGAFPFGTREDLLRGMELIYHHFTQFG